MNLQTNNNDFPCIVSYSWFKFREHSRVKTSLDMQDKISPVGAYFMVLWSKMNLWRSADLNSYLNLGTWQRVFSVQSYPVYALCTANNATITRGASKITVIKLTCRSYSEGLTLKLYQLLPKLILLMTNCKVSSSWSNHVLNS